MAEIPRGPEEITVDWLNTVLEEGDYLQGHKVVSVLAKDSGTPGQTAEIARVTVEYEDADCPLPRNMIAKYTSRNSTTLNATVSVYQLYWRETAFYREFTDIGIATPTCYFAGHEMETQRFMLLLKDLAPAESPSWASTPEQVAMAVSHLPAFHARWWNDPLLRTRDWLVQFDNLDFYHAAAGAAAASLPKVLEYFGESAAETIEVLTLWNQKIDRVLEYVASRPFTLVHGDYHAKQLFFPSAAGGEFAVIDWQFSWVAQGAWDLIRIMAMGQGVEDRRANQARLIEGYYAGLTAAGVTNYTMAQLEDDIRIGLVVNQMIMAIAVGDTDISVFERECNALGVDWKDVCLLRGNAAVQDWRVKDFLIAL